MKPRRQTQGYGFIPSVVITGVLLYTGLYVSEHIGVAKAQQALEQRLSHTTR